jgi:hypothetical protein
MIIKSKIDYIHRIRISEKRYIYHILKITTYILLYFVYYHNNKHYTVISYYTKIYLKAINSKRWYIYHKSFFSSFILILIMV